MKGARESERAKGKEGTRKEKSAYIEWQEARMRERDDRARVTLERAKQGDWWCLADHLTCGEKANIETTIEINNFIVDVLDQRIKRPPNRVARPANDFQSAVFNMEVTEATKTEKNRDAAVAKVAEEHGVSTRTVWRAISRERVEAAMRTMIRLHGRPPAGTPRYLISDAALAVHTLP